MKATPLMGSVLCIGLLVSVAAGGGILPVDNGPGPVVKDWYIYSDTQLDGILNPGDTMLGTFQNWWTPVSAHTQYNYGQGAWGARPGWDGLTYGDAEDKSGSPHSFSSDNWWETVYLPIAKNRLNFYMTFSQYDNNDFTTFTDGKTGEALEIIQQRNMYRNGFSLGYIAHDFTRGSDPVLGDNLFTNDQTPLGQLHMDVFVHNGRSDTADLRSNPQVSLSDDISQLAKAQPDTVRYSVDGDQYQVPNYDSFMQAYTAAANPHLTMAELLEIVDSMEFREVDPMAVVAQYAGRSPAEILAALNYQYQDAFHARHNMVEGATDGGIISGLAGHSLVGDPHVDWANQQVIRIDFNLLEGIDEIVFWDFTDQLNPTPIIIRLADLPEQRLYIALADIVPEPASVVMLGLGALAFVRRRNRRVKLTR